MTRNDFKVQINNAVLDKNIASIIKKQLSSMKDLSITIDSAKLGNIKFAIQKELNSLSNQKVDMQFRINTKELGSNSLKMAKDLNTSASNALEVVKLYSNAKAISESMLQQSKPADLGSYSTGLNGLD